MKCLVCGTSFKAKPSSNRKYCSRACWLSRSEGRGCSVAFCNSPHEAKGYCSLHYRRAKGEHATPLEAPKRTGVGHIALTGYRRWYKGGKYITEHRLIMQEHLGRVLSRYEHVHHVNHDKTDNRLDNLLVISPSEHSRYHSLKRWGHL